MNRLLYGERDDPYTVLARFGRRLEATLAPSAVLPTIVEMVAQALKLPYVAVTVPVDDQHEARGAGNAQAAGASAAPAPAHRYDGEVVATHGTAVANLLRLPLVYHNEMVGHLLLAPRAPGEAFSPADVRLLEDLARQIGVAVHAARLSDDLRRSRARLVTAREEERRRLRRDLHDGLGPTLASLAQRLDTAAVLAPRDPHAAVALLHDLKGQVKGTIADIRRLVYALRPPALDELGLLGALREHAAAYEEAAGVRVTLLAPAALPPLPAAVEVAAYRIASEALTNVARHAHARACCLRLEVAAALCLEISDDGVGLPVPYQAGVGLASMRERAAEVGGTLAVTPGPHGGTRVRATLPMEQE